MPAAREPCESDASRSWPALDTSVALSGHIDWLKGEGIVAVGRYHSRHDWKRLGRDEAVALSNAGIAIFVVYQDRQNEPADFSAAEGERAGRMALACAGEVGQPAGTAIYLAVDYDASADDLGGRVVPYFRSARDVLEPEGFKVGVYGSGLTCATLLDGSLATYAWLGMETTHRGHAQFLRSGRWAIAQKPSIGVPFAHDPCELNFEPREVGAFFVRLP